jgi:hypothetical protein
MRLGETLACVVCDAAIVVLEASDPGPGPTCCGRAMVSARPAPCSARQPDGGGEIGGGTVAGSLYADEQLGLVVRCVRRGSGAITCSGRAMREIPAEVSDRGALLRLPLLRRAAPLRGDHAPRDRPAPARPA